MPIAVAAAFSATVRIADAIGKLRALRVDARSRLEGEPGQLGDRQDLAAGHRGHPVGEVNRPIGRQTRYRYR